jgi:LPS export ABC transporter protein LptC
MMTGFRNLLWILPLVSLLGWPLWGQPVIRFLTPPGSFDSQAAVKGKKRVAQAESFSMDQVLFTQLTNGSRDWQIKTNRLYTAQNSDKMQMETVEAGVFEGNSRKFHITGEEGVYDNKKKVLVLEKNVRVEAEDGYIVHSDRLRYDDGARKITTKSAVHITADDMDIQGKGLVYDIKKGAYEVGGRVTVQSW